MERGRTIRLSLPRPHPAQQRVISEARRFNVVCAGRRSGKSELGLLQLAKPLLAGMPCALFAPTYKNLAEMWREAGRIFWPATHASNQQEHRLELISGGVLEMWSLDSADTARGRRYARVILDECAMVRDLADAWNLVIRPTLVDLQGDAYFLSTPRGKNDFAGLYALGESEAEPDWACWRFPTAANPFIAPAEIEALRRQMPARAFEQEIEARFIDEVSGALWTYDLIDSYRLSEHPPLARIVIAIDPAISANPDSDETGIIAAGSDDRSPPHGYILADASGSYSPLGWASKAVAQYESLRADRIVAEVNNGGDMVESTLRSADISLPYKQVRASRGKLTRAEPVAALYEQGRVHHVGIFAELECQMTSWSPPDDRDSPDRVDALVWALSELLLGSHYWSPEERAAWARGDYLAGDDRAAMSALPDQEGYLREVEEIQAARLRALRGL